MNTTPSKQIHFSKLSDDQKHILRLLSQGLLIKDIGSVQHLVIDSGFEDPVKVSMTYFTALQKNKIVTTAARGAGYYQITELGTKVANELFNPNAPRVLIKIEQQRDIRELIATHEKYIRVNESGAGRKNIHKPLVLMRADLSKMNIGPALLRSAKFIKCDFSHANLNNADLRFATFIGCNFTAATLKRANFSKALLQGANFTRAILDNAIFDGADLTPMIEDTANENPESLDRMMQGDLDWFEQTLPAPVFVNFDKAIMTSTLLRGARISGASFRNANLDKADLTRADLQNADFSYCSIQKTNFTSANMNRADLSLAAGLSEEIRRTAKSAFFGVSPDVEILNEILRSNERWARSGGKEGCRASLAGMNLSGVDLSKTYLAGADLKRCNLAGANLSECILVSSVLLEANLMQAQLEGADLRGAYTTGAVGLPSEAPPHERPTAVLPQALSA
jgi:uncharacterized protein YjbI with pentapeptide repeats